MHLENSFWCCFQCLPEQERPSGKHQFFLLILDYGQGSIIQKSNREQTRGSKMSGIHQPGLTERWRVMNFIFVRDLSPLTVPHSISPGVFLHHRHLTTTESYFSVGGKRIQSICIQSAFKHQGRWKEMRIASLWWPFHAKVYFRIQERKALWW